ncbi:MAG: hypothetical protein WDO17_00560 [Alphaproteobacteria bacterium]
MNRYLLKSVSPDDFNRELDKLWAQLTTDPGLQEDAADAGIDVEKLPRGKRRDLISVKVPAHFDVVTGAVITIVLAPVAKKILIDLWSKLLLPRLERKFGLKPAASKSAATAKKKKKK